MKEPLHRQMGQQPELLRLPPLKLNLPHLRRKLRKRNRNSKINISVKAHLFCADVLPFCR